MWIKICLVFFIIVGLLFALIGFAYLSSSSTMDSAYHFLADRESWYSSMRDSTWGKQTVTVYCFFGYHDNISYMARKELLDLGYVEVSAPIRYDSGDYRFNPRHRLVRTEFRKEGVFTSISVRIGKGKFLEERPDGNLSFSSELDWINVVIHQTRSPFSLRRVLQYWSNKLFRRGTRQRTVPMP